MQSVEHDFCTLTDGRKLPFGLMVWSTGLAPVEVVQRMEGVKKDRGRIVVDKRLRVPGLEGVFAMGDAAIESERPLGPLAQVADQQGKVNGVLCTSSRHVQRSIDHDIQIFCFGDSNCSSLEIKKCYHGWCPTCSSWNRFRPFGTDLTVAIVISHRLPFMCHGAGVG